MSRRLHFKLIVKEKVNPETLRNSTLITGFRGFGLVGYLATKYLRDKLNPKLIGYIVCDRMPSIVYVSNGKLALPHELYLYSNGKAKILLLLNNALPSIPLSLPFARYVLKWAKKVGVKECLFIGGLNKSFNIDGDDARYLANSYYTKPIPGKILENELPVAGPLASMIIYSEILKLPSLTILPYTDPMRPDPHAAAIAVEKVSTLLNIAIDVTELYEGERMIQEELKNLIEYYKELEKEKSMYYM
ncbi:MAG TPA: proteasome assembly chaperone family protein [Desulfurococcales archaeon]|nr:proteasome assembly chaperone family protein [Desulfurococcales archaeon]